MTRLGHLNYDKIYGLCYLEQTQSATGPIIQIPPRSDNLLFQQLPFFVLISHQAEIWLGSNPLAPKGFGEFPG